MNSLWFQACRAGLLLVVAFAPVPAIADSPPPDPTRTEFCSKNGKFCVTTDPGPVCEKFCDRRYPGPKTTFAYPKGQPKSKLWEMPRFVQTAFLSDDGEYLVIGYPYESLILDYKPTDSLVSFYRRGTLIKAWTVQEIIKDLNKLERTMSHWWWGHFLGFTAPHEFSLETIEGKRVFDVTNGGLLRSEPLGPDSDVKAMLDIKARQEAFYAELNSVTDAIKNRGAKAALTDMLNHRSKWEALLNHVARGELSWLDVAERIAAVSDGHATEELQIAVARGITHSPDGTLIFLETSKSFSVATICGLLDSEGSVKDWLAELEKRRAALQTVHRASSENIRSQCLKAVMKEIDYQKNRKDQ